MKKRKVSVIFLVFVCLLLLMGCGNKQLSQEAQKICGDWAYIHDRDTTVVSFDKNGKAKYEGKKYTFTCDDTFVYLKNKDGEQKLRYVMDGDKMFLYKNTEYKFCGEGEPDGIIGSWESTENWKFEFTENGTFLEDGYFPGLYIMTENSGVKLVYNDQFEDTLCYYHVDGNTLVLEYPWPMVITGTK